MLTAHDPRPRPSQEYDPYRGVTDSRRSLSSGQPRYYNEANERNQSRQFGVPRSPHDPYAAHRSEDRKLTTPRGSVSKPKSLREQRLNKYKCLLRTSVVLIVLGSLAFVGVIAYLGAA